MSILEKDVEFVDESTVDGKMELDISYFGLISTKGKRDKYQE